jgi:hypothetical protein
MKRLQPIAQSQQSQDKKNAGDSIDKPVPLIRFSSKLDGLDEKVLSIKLRNYSKDFKDNLESVLELYPDDQLKYSSKLVAFVMHEVERFVLKPKQGVAKRSLVIDCCKKYFNDDPELVSVVIDLLFKELKQIRFIKRQGLKLCRFFLNLRRRASSHNRQ